MDVAESTASAVPSLRVLMIAYACTPRRGGEHLLGWEWATRLAGRHQVTVLTQAARLADEIGTCDLDYF